MFSFIKAKPIVDETSRQWIFDAFEWALSHFDGDFFTQHSKLILPTHAFFPARAQSVEQLAQSVFDAVRHYCGLRHWPFQLVAPVQFAPNQIQLKQPITVIRSDSEQNTALEQAMQNPQDKLSLSYDPIQINQPQVMVANYAAMFSGYLMSMSAEPPPGGDEYRLPSIELLGIFMGFGVMFSNTAYAFRGSCGSCHNHAANRTAVLSENEAIYATALFCVLKDIENAAVTGHLKSHLRGMYKQAVKQVKSYPQALQQLRHLMTNETAALA